MAKKTLGLSFDICGEHPYNTSPIFHNNKTSGLDQTLTLSPVSPKIASLEFKLYLIYNQFIFFTKTVDRQTKI